MAEHQVPCEVYSRVVGYLRPVQNWNAGKKQEFAERKPFVVANTPGYAASDASDRRPPAASNQ